MAVWSVRKLRIFTVCLVVDKNNTARKLRKTELYLGSIRFILYLCSSFCGSTFCIFSLGENMILITEPPHDKTNNVVVCPAKTQVSLGICPVWSESSLSAWRKLGSLATHWVHSKDSDQTGQMPRLIWVFAWHTVILFVLSWGGWYVLLQKRTTDKACVN